MSSPIDGKRVLAAGLGLGLLATGYNIVSQKLAEVEAARRRKACESMDFRVAIVGAGMSGICMAIKLQEAGIPFVILEQSGNFGGTWNNNVYPDCACDVPIHVYSFSFDPRSDWKRKWAPQADILAYFNEVADKHDLRAHTRFGTSVEGATWDAASQRWLVRLRDCASGARSEEPFAVFVPATGQLDRPRRPALPGLDSFEGASWHTAEWPRGESVKGKRVVGLGNGPSAIQAFPAVAREAAHLTVVQRSPVWCIAKNDYEYSALAKAAFANVPLVRRLYRAALFFQTELSYFAIIDAANKNGAGKLVREHTARAMADTVRGKVDLDKVIPKYPMGCKRVALTDNWMPMLASDNVTLETRHVVEVLPRGVKYADGHEEDCDVIVYATGFQTLQFLAHLDIRDGRGTSLQAHWDGVARAYKGMAVAGFPNMFILYGPGTNLGHSSIIFMVETQVNYVVRLLEHMVDARVPALQVKEEAYAADFEELQRDLQKTVFVDDSCTSWYKRADGLVVNNWSKSCTAYWRKLRANDLDAYAPAPAKL